MEFREKYGEEAESDDEEGLEVEETNEGKENVDDQGIRVEEDDATTSIPPLSYTPSAAHSTLASTRFEVQSERIISAVEREDVVSSQERDATDQDTPASVIPQNPNSTPSLTTEPSLSAASRPHLEKGVSSGFDTATSKVITAGASSEEPQEKIATSTPPSTLKTSPAIPKSGGGALGHKTSPMPWGPSFGLPTATVVKTSSNSVDQRPSSVLNPWFLVNGLPSFGLRPPSAKRSRPTDDDGNEEEGPASLASLTKKLR